MFEIKEPVEKTDRTILEQLSSLDQGNITTKMLIIEGHILSKVLSDQKLEETFFAVAKDAPSVCICRCSPT